MTICLAWNAPTFWRRSSSRVSVRLSSGRSFAALENRLILAGILRGGVYDAKFSAFGTSSTSLTKSASAGAIRASRALSIGACQAMSRQRSLYTRIGAPVTLVYGDHDWSKPADRKANLSLIEQARMIELKDTGHFSALERPEQFTQIVLETLSGAQAVVQAQNAIRLRVRDIKRLPSGYAPNI